MNVGLYEILQALAYVAEENCVCDDNGKEVGNCAVCYARHAFADMQAFLANDVQNIDQNICKYLDALEEASHA